MAHDDEAPALLASFAALSAAVDDAVWAPLDDGGRELRFPTPDDPRAAGGGTLVLTPEALRALAAADPQFPGETFPDGVCPGVQRRPAGPPDPPTLRP